MIKSNIGKTIKKHRKLAGLSQDELAAKIGVKRQTISSWEVDRTEPSIQDVQAMAKVFGCKVSDLIPDRTVYQVALEKTFIDDYYSLTEEHRKQVNDYISFLKQKEKASPTVSQMTS